ncbi:hypothetical protein NE237_026651 [Protea cynaroides]|uniref:Uncharacterized protein n=1 Tax=Protea cynaroides TaxID=273540 RepID=A0A9Q0K2H9_9MAGN|nr:hypothetical protein NE237_026651 [Protea cynaroides]
MRCKRHPSDTSSGVGVCASCLRERLFTLIAAQACQQAQALSPAQTQAEDRRKSDAQHPPPLIFPRSVSPFNDPSRQQHHHKFDQRFYRSPQVRPTSAPTTATSGAAQKKKKHSMTSLLASLFGSKSEEPEPGGPDHRASRGSRTSLGTSPSSSPIPQKWLSALIPSRRKKESRLFSLDDAATTDGGRRIYRREDRGLSPVSANVIIHNGDNEESSSYSSECSPHKHKQGLQIQSTPPHTTPTRACRRGQPSRKFSGLAVCFSPLVRASPRHHRSAGVLW